MPSTAFARGRRQDAPRSHKLVPIKSNGREPGRLSERLYFTKGEPSARSQSGGRYESTNMPVAAKATDARRRYGRCARENSLNIRQTAVADHLPA
jgi:hypothetical protein